MPQHTLFYRFGVALLIGLLVGIQREYDREIKDRPHEREPAGVRTFTLIALTGSSAAFIGDLLGSAWPFVVIAGAAALMITTGYAISAWRGKPGLTTEIAGIVTLLAGALCFLDEIELAAALGVVTTGLLSLKIELHQIAERITRDDILATLKFAVITVIVLPVLPNESFGPPPFDVLNPYKIWLMVVLISGISFLGYFLMQIVGARQGISLTGILGGLASSTATTLSFSQRSHSNERLGRPFALAITLAWTIMFVRILIEVAAVHAPLLRIVWIPITAAGAAGLVYGVYLYLAPSAADQGEVKVSNPFELRPAITFGILYAVIILASRAAEYYFGSTGLYLSSILSGLADVDAITLSMAELSRTGNVDMETAARAIGLAAMANTAVKGGIVISSGSMTLRRAFLPGFLLILVVGVSVSFLL